MDMFPRVSPQEEAKVCPWPALRPVQPGSCLSLPVNHSSTTFSTHLLVSGLPQWRTPAILPLTCFMCKGTVHINTWKPGLVLAPREPLLPASGLVFIKGVQP